MAKPKLHTSTNLANKQISVLRTHIASMGTLEIKYQYFIAELTMLRLFAIIESNIAHTAYKLLTGAHYLNGKSPNLLIPSCSSMNASRNAMSTHGRGKNTRQLSWAQNKEIKKNLTYTMDSNDPFLNCIATYSSTITEMRKVRNFIAHKNESSRKKFKEAVRTRYGANLKISTGPFLLSTKRHSISNLTQYITASSLLVTDISSGK